MRNIVRILLLSGFFVKKYLKEELQVKKIILILMMVFLVLITGCKDSKKNLYLPESENDKIYTTIGGADKSHKGESYTISIPTKDYRYDKDYDDGALEEKWEYTKKDDVQIKVTTYKKSDEISARNKFLREYDDYIFEDLMGYSLCGQEIDGDTLWFNLHVSGETVYIVSWEFPKNTSEDLQKELSDIAGTFTIEE